CTDISAMRRPGPPAVSLLSQPAVSLFWRERSCTDRGPKRMSTSTSQSIPDGEAPKPQRPGLNQPITGIVPPQLAEAIIRTAWPSVTAASPAAANLARPLIRSVVLAPLGWAILFWPFLKRLLFVPRRYTLTNRRLMIQVLPNIFVLMVYPLVYLLYALT